ncbi:unnamed protein product [Linum tenue]|uniref:Prolamin-like domain-containing protein n=1 Tax=Linum tenue TaxID=586396 RepID=A0AAV0MH08_9ROSI|nr:unnamed protein product [Linum tenue]
MEPKVAAKCWIAILEVPLCVFQIVKAFGGGSVFSIGKACCHAFIDLTDDCKIEVFQKSEFFPAIEKFCAAIGGGGATNTTTTTAGLGNHSEFATGVAESEKQSAAAVAKISGNLGAAEERSEEKRSGKVGEEIEIESDLEIEIF